MKEAAPVKPKFFPGPDAFRRWLEKNHGGVSELWIGLHKVHTGRKGLTYAQAVDEALCFGWIDGLVKRFDAAAAKRFRAGKKAWAFFEAQPPGYRRTATHWVMSANLFSGEKTPAKA